MNVPTKLAGFAVILLASFGATFGIGRAVGPGDDTPPAPMAPMTTTTTAPDHGGHS